MELKQTRLKRKIMLFFVKLEGFQLFDIGIRFPSIVGLVETRPANFKKHFRFAARRTAVSNNRFDLPCQIIKCRDFFVRNSWILDIKFQTLKMYLKFLVTEQVRDGVVVAIDRNSRVQRIDCAIW